MLFWPVTWLAGVASTGLLAASQGFGAFVAWVTTEDWGRAVTFSEEMRVMANTDLLNDEMFRASEALVDIFEKGEVFEPVDQQSADDFRWAESIIGVDHLDREANPSAAEKVFSDYTARWESSLDAPFEQLGSDIIRSSAVITDNVSCSYGSLIEAQNGVIEKIMNTADSCQYQNGRRTLNILVNLGKTGEGRILECEGIGSLVEIFDCPSEELSSKIAKAVDKLCTEQTAMREELRVGLLSEIKRIVK